MGLSIREKKTIRRVLLRAFNKNQILILSHINHDSHSMSFVLKRISEGLNIPLSTLKFNARILKDLGLIDFGNISNFKKPRITKSGHVILNFIENEVNKDE